VQTGRRLNGRRLHACTSRLDCGELLGRGVEVSDVQEFPWGSFVFFSDPDGNSWSVLQLPPRS
jgi:hypothetical protein